MPSFKDALPYDAGMAQAVMDDPSRESLLIYSDWLEENAPQYAADMREFAEHKVRPQVQHFMTYTGIIWKYPSGGYLCQIPRLWFNEITGPRKQVKRFGVLVLTTRRARRSAATRAQGYCEFIDELDDARAYLAAILTAAVGWRLLEERQKRKRLERERPKRIDTGHLIDSLRYASVHEFGGRP